MCFCPESRSPCVRSRLGRRLPSAGAFCRRRRARSALRLMARDAFGLGGRRNHFCPQRPNYFPDATVPAESLLRPDPRLFGKTVPSNVRRTAKWQYAITCCSHSAIPFMNSHPGPFPGLALPQGPRLKHATTATGVLIRKEQITWKCFLTLINSFSDLTLFFSLISSC